MAALLSHEGALVQIAHTAEEALETLTTFAAQVLIVDPLLPKMSGLGLVEILKATPATNGIVAIAVGASTLLRSEQLALESGCAGYVSKPIDVQSFPAMVGDLYEKHHTTRAKSEREMKQCAR